MSTIASLLTLHAERLRDSASAAALQDARSRISTMMLIYDKLYHSQSYTNVNALQYFSELLNEIEATYVVGNAHVTLHRELENLEIPARHAFAVGLIVNEVVSNALRHAFPDSRSGYIRVVLRRTPGGSVEISVADDGVGLPAETTPGDTGGFGLDLVKIMVEQIGATLEIRRNRGTTFVITFTS
jgi:two-component sensor histidine kinase